VRAGHFGGGWVEDLSDAGIDGEGGILWRRLLSQLLY
jgi:hypothetical protein